MHISRTFKELERGTAASADVADLGLGVVLGGECGRVASTDDCGCPGGSSSNHSVKKSDGWWLGECGCNGNGDIAHDLDPLAKLGNSNTPMGPFQTIVLARSTASVNLDQRRGENV